MLLYSSYGPGEEEGALGSIGSESKPRIVLMGLRRSAESATEPHFSLLPSFPLSLSVLMPCSMLIRSGKSSISKVVFHKLSPNETLFLESTSKVVKDDISNSSFVQFQVSAQRVCTSVLFFIIGSFSSLTRYGTFQVRLISLTQPSTLTTYLVVVELSFSSSMLRYVPSPPSFRTGM